MFSCFYYTGPLPFSALLDIRGSGVIRISTPNKSFNQIVGTCSQNQFFDPNRGCVDLICPNGSTALAGICSKPNSGNEDEGNNTEDEFSSTKGDEINVTSPSTLPKNCRFVALNSSEFSYLNTSAVLYQGRVLNVIAYMYDDTGRPIVCLELEIMVNGSITILQYPPGFALLTYIGCSLSIVASILIIITYTIFKELHTLPSMLLVNLAVVFVFGDLFLFISGVASQTISSVEICSFIGILLHFLFLCRFTWMNCLGIEYTRTFLLAVKLEKRKGKPTQIRLFLFYSLIGWGVPLLITTITVIINYTVKGAVRYGTDKDGTRGLCWINDMTVSLVAFVIPILVSILLNCIFFVVVVILICIASQTSVKDLKRTHVRVILGIFAVLGITWLLGLIAIFSTKTWAWYPFIVINSNQAVIIAIAFLATKKILLLYWSAISCNWFKSSKKLQN